MMKKLIVLVTIILCVALVGSAMALPKGKVMTFETKMGNVTFSGDTHAEKAGLNCMSCHPKVFAMKAGAATLAVPHKLDESCGTCHNGDKAFSQTDGAKCKSCHK